MNKVFLLFIAQVMIVFSVFGQITFQERISGDETEFGESVKQTSDNGYVIAGWTSSFGAGNYTYDALLIKFSSLGVIEWAKMYGGADQERIFSVQQVSDGGYILAGITKSFGPDDSEDFLLIRTNSVGDTIWTKIYGDLSINKEDWAYSVIETTTNDFVVVGCSSDWEAFVIKVNSSGNLLWSKKYGYGNYSTDEAFDIKETNDGGYIIAGRATDSEDGYYFDAFLLKTDINGNVEWFKTYGEIIEDDAARSVIQTSDNGYILVGETQSYNTNMDILVIKTDSFGTPIWAKTYGGAASDYGYSIKENGSGGYFIGGYTYSFSGDEAYIININSTGNTIWSKIYGLSGAAYIYDIQTTFDGGIVFTGDYGSDIYFGKLDGVGNSGCNQNDVITDVSIITPTIKNLTITGSGATESSASLTISNPTPSNTVLCSNTDILQNQVCMKQIVYPNPAHDYIYIENIENNKTQIEVYNSTGQKIIEASNMQKIDISSLTPGLYVVKIKTTGSYFNSKSISSKFIKK